MALKVAVNGFGRIGRCVSRIIAAREDIELVAINDIMGSQMMAYLLQNDSVHGGNEDIYCEEDTLYIGGKPVRLSHADHPQKIDFAASGAELVIESSGIFLTQEYARHYIQNGVKKVILSAPAEDTQTPTFVLGVNEMQYQDEAIISNASCTTNCLAPIAKLLDDTYGIDKGLMTTVHSYTNDQKILDSVHANDKRRARAAAVNLIPTSTGAAKAIGRVLPNLQGKLHGQSVRVPVPDVSMMDLDVVLKQDVDQKALQKLFKEASQSTLHGILLVDEGMRVSQDFVNSPYSAIVADDLVQVIGGNLVKIMAWYDNEWGYSNRLVEMALHITKQMRN
jgi:glyceraldehyde 3-phosphate dehydrogenase